MYWVHEVSPLHTYSVTQPLQLRSDCGDKPPTSLLMRVFSGNTAPLLRGSAALRERDFWLCNIIEICNIYMRPRLVADVQILIQGSSVVEGHRCFVLQRICVGE
jgi:hypothetical protein